MQPIRNPYIVGNPVEDSRMFFGRDDDFSFIRAKMSGCETGGMIVLCGTRRSGKTSILFQILQGRLGPDYVPVLLDLQSLVVQGDSEFVTLLAGRIITTVRDRLPDLEFVPISQDFGDVTYAFRYLCKQVRDRLDGASLVIMFDEYELFETRIDEGAMTTRVLDLLGDTIRRDAGVFLLFTGSEKLESRNADYWTSSLGKSLHRRISFLTNADAMRLVREPVQNLVRYEPGVPERILELGAGQPFYTQVICQALVDQLNELDKSEATHADIDAVVQGIIANPLPHMIFAWGGLSDIQKLALASLGALSRDEACSLCASDILTILRTEKTGITLAEDKLNEALERLFQEDLLEKSEDGTRFSFKMDLWRLWIGRMHSIWQALDEIRHEGRKPEEGIISVSGRRLKRIGLGVAALLITLPILSMTLRSGQTPYIPAVAPDSTLVSVHTQPDGAKVFIDNYLIGRTPLDNVKVETGRSQMRLEMEGFRDQVDSVTFLADTLNAFQSDLHEMTGGMLIDSRPGGAAVTIDGGALRLPTPVRVDSLSARTLHEVVLQLPGHLPGRYRNVQVFPDSTVVFTHDFNKPTHPLTITTTPTGAVILVDGEEVGRGPVSLASVVEGSHRLECRLDGHFVVTRDIDIPAAGNRVDVVLSALPPGHLVLRVQPYADILVDERLLAASAVSHSVAVPQGLHIVEFRHPHFGAFRREVKVMSEDTMVVQHRFEGSEP